MVSFFSNLSITSLSFFVFVLVALAAYYLLPPKFQNPLLLFASFLFCLSWDWTFAAALFIVSVFNYFAAIKISEKTGEAKLQWLWASILLNIGLLFLGKNIHQAGYYFFKALLRMGITENFYEANLLQPIGISFYILQAISYLVDVYRGQIPVNRNFIEVSLYLAYFPKLLAGPIERAQPFFTQLRAQRIIENQQATAGLITIFTGLIRKIVISDSIFAAIPPKIFETPQHFSAANLILWWLVFVFVIYNDFAGYTSIARGVSGLFGISLSQNFEQPFFSTSFIDFWNRWHISLSNWLRDYIYLPVSRWMLHRNPSGKYLPNLIIPPLATMLVSGIWHGATPQFLLWGALNGLLQAAERVQKSWKKGGAPAPPKWKTAAGAAASMFVIIFINIPFKFDMAQSITFIQKVFSFDAAGVSLILFVKPALAMLLSLYMDGAQSRQKDETSFLLMPQKARAFLLAAGILLLFLSTRQQTAAPFIYQEF